MLLLNLETLLWHWFQFHFLSFPLFYLFYIFFLFFSKIEEKHFVNIWNECNYNRWTFFHYLHNHLIFNILEGARAVNKILWYICRKYLFVLYTWRFVYKSFITFFRHVLDSFAGRNTFDVLFLACLRCLELIRFFCFWKTFVKLRLFLCTIEKFGN